MRSSTRGLAAVLGLVLAGCSSGAALLSPVPVDAAPFEAVLDRTPASVGKLLSTSCTGSPIAGSGFVVAPDLVLTGAHVVSGARQVSLRLTGAAPVLADVVGIDPSRDTALVRTRARLDASALGLADDAATPGTEVATLGFPLGESVLDSVVARITSVTDSAIVNARPVHDLVTVDATLRTGTSGGPLIDADGTVRGMVVAAIGGRGGRDSVPTVALAIPPASLAASLDAWRDEPPALEVGCVGEPAREPGPAPDLEVATRDPQAAEFVHTLWLLGQGINAGHATGTWGMLAPDRRAAEGGADAWAAWVGSTRWESLRVLDAERSGDRARVTVRLRATTDGLCRLHELRVDLALDRGIWLVGTASPVTAAAACG